MNASDLQKSNVELDPSVVDLSPTILKKFLRFKRKKLNE